VGDPGEPVPEVALPPIRSEVRGPKSGVKEPRAPGAQKSSPLPGERVPDVGGRVRGPSPAQLSSEGSCQTVSAIAEPQLFRISPRAAKLAKDCVIDPAPIAGTGPSGRIVERDVKQYLEAQGYSRVRITPTAKKLAAREG